MISKARVNRWLGKLEGANLGDSYSAELATGYRWGEPKLKPHVQRVLAQARAEGNERLEQLAELLRAES